MLEEGRGGGRVEDAMGGRLSWGRVKVFAFRVSTGLGTGEGSAGGREREHHMA